MSVEAKKKGAAEERNKVEEQKRKGDDKNEKKDSGHLCTIMCDFLCGLEPTHPLLWDSGISEKVLSGFRKCDKDVPCDLGEDAIGIDIRGHHVDNALDIMMTHLYCWSGKPNFKKLYVTVGCKVHGCGEGKLLKAATDELDKYDILLDKVIDYDILYNSAIICIPLKGNGMDSLLAE